MHTKMTNVLEKRQMMSSKQKFLAVAVAIACGASIVACGGGGGGSGSSTAAQVDQKETRSVTLLDKQNWKFIQDDNLTDDNALANDGSAWGSVTLPHTWNASDAASIAQTTPTTASYKRGRGWYRLEFNSPSSGTTQWLQFNGASIVADVWLNGVKLGEHKGAFTAFRFDVTNALKSGKNVLLVKTDNSQPAAGTDLTAIVPLSGDFNMSGGLYRSVSLVSTVSASHFALDDYGSTGIYARSTSISQNAATVNVLARLKNDSSADATYTVQTTLAGADGTLVKTASQPAALKKGASLDVSQDLSVSNPHLWNGIADPSLYKLIVDLKDSSGTVIDRVVQDYGIRSMKFDPDKGFFLNGNSVPLHGVDMHQDYQDKGWAITNADTDESLGLIKEIGANTVRLAHYPHASYTLQQTDKLGFVVWAELPFVNQTAVPCTGATNSELTANAKQQLQELIRQQYNHSSIAMWSIGNETTQGCGMPGNATPLLRELQTLAKAEDPSRVTTLASNGYFDDTGSISDIWALNQYPLWYSGAVSDMGATLDAQHTKRPTQPIGISEYGAGAALSHQSDNLTGADSFITSFDMSGKTRIVYQPENYASYVHEQDYAVLTARQYIWGTYVWNMFDFGSGIRHEGDVGGTNTKGLVSFDRKTKKDPFFFYKANWSSSPVMYITGKHYTNRAYPTTDVKVYSNADSVTLKVNGSSVGTLSADKCPQHACTFSAVQLAQGDNTISAEGSVGGKSVSDSLVWSLDNDHASNFYITAGNPTTGFISEASGALGVAKRFGSDNYFSGGVRQKLPNTLMFGPLNNVGTTTTPAEGRVWDYYREEATGGDNAATLGSKFSYSLKLLPGKTYLVTVGFLEPVKTAAGQRLFNVTATANSQTQTVISNLDVFAKAGGKGTAYAQKFPVTVGADGSLKLEFQGVNDKAMVSNIMVVQQ